MLKYSSSRIKCLPYLLGTKTKIQLNNTKTSDKELPSGYQVKTKLLILVKHPHWNRFLVRNFKATGDKFWLEKQISYFKSLKSCKIRKSVYYVLFYLDCVFLALKRTAKAAEISAALWSYTDWGLNRDTVDLLLQLFNNEIRAFTECNVISSPNSNKRMLANIEYLLRICQDFRYSGKWCWGIDSPLNLSGVYRFQSQCLEVFRQE